MTNLQSSNSYIFAPCLKHLKKVSNMPLSAPSNWGCTRTSFVYITFFACVCTKVQFMHLGSKISGVELAFLSAWRQARRHGMVWGGNCHPWVRGYHLFATPENFLAIFYCCFIFVAKERFPKVLVQINLGLYSILENSIFP